MSFSKPSFFKRFHTRQSDAELDAPVVEPKKITSSSSASSLNTKDRQEAYLAQILEQPVVDLEEIRKMAWMGIPNKYRAEVWRLFLDYEPVNKDVRKTTLEHKRHDYFDCLDKLYGESQQLLWTNGQKATVKQILADLPRTHVPLLRNENVQKLFERVLFVWSVRHPASGYVQGMHDLLQPFFFVFIVPFCDMKSPLEISKRENVDDIPEEDMKTVEADCFWCFSKLLDGLQDLYTKDQPGLYKMLDNLQSVIEKVDVELSNHIKEEEIQFQEFAFRWINCLLVREFSVNNIFRIWDNYLSYPNKIATTHVYVCAAMMEVMAYKLMPLNHAEFVLLMQAIVPEGWRAEEIEEILAQSYVYEKTLSGNSTRSRSLSTPIFR